MTRQFWNWSAPSVDEENSDPDVPGVRVLLHTG